MSPLKNRRGLEEEFKNVKTDANTIRVFTPTEAEDAILKSVYFPIMKSAKQDKNNYSGLSGVFATEEGRAMYYYTQNPPAGYGVEFPNENIFKIRIRINPCISRGGSDTC